MRHHKNLRDTIIFDNAEEASNWLTHHGWQFKHHSTVFPGTYVYKRYDGVATLHQHSETEFCINFD